MDKSYSAFTCPINHILSITFDDKQYFVLIIKQETSRGIGPSLDKGRVSHP